MGSSQSQPTSPPSSSPPITQQQQQQQQQQQHTKSEESGYALAKRKCAKKQRLYDACYTAALSHKEEDCAELFESYKRCFLKWMSRDMERRGVRVSADSMVGEFLEEEDENR